MAAADTISFARGAPSLDIVDVEGLKAAAARAFDNDPGGTTAYGTSVGYVPLREWIAAKHGVDTAQVLVTNGSMQADAFLFETLVQPGEDVVVEKPTYDRTLLNLRSLGAAVHPVALERDGIDVAELDALIDGGVRPQLAHVIPNFQNPAGYTLSLPKRRRLLEMARDAGFVIFEDDPYVDIRFSGDPLPTMLSMDEAGAVVYASSFSKTVCPGIRVGYLVGPAALIADIQKLATNTYISPNMVAQSIVHEFCVSGRDRPLDRDGQGRAGRARRAARRPRWPASFPRPATRHPRAATSCGSSCPRRSTSTASSPRPRSAASLFVKGSDFLLEGGSNTLRLAYSGVTADQIDEGVRRLAGAIRAVEASAAA